MNTPTPPECAYSSKFYYSNILKRRCTPHIAILKVLDSKYPTDLCSNHRNVRTRRTHSIQTQIHTTYCHSKSAQRHVLNRMYSNKRSDQNHLIQTSLSVLKHQKERSGRYRMICFIQAYETHEFTTYC